MRLADRCLGAEGTLFCDCPAAIALSARHPLWRPPTPQVIYKARLHGKSNCRCQRLGHSPPKGQAWLAGSAGSDSDRPGWEWLLALASTRHYDVKSPQRATKDQACLLQHAGLVAVNSWRQAAQTCFLFAGLQGLLAETSSVPFRRSRYRTSD